MAKDDRATAGDAGRVFDLVEETGARVLTSKDGEARKVTMGGRR